MGFHSTQNSILTFNSVSCGPQAKDEINPKSQHIWSVSSFLFMRTNKLGFYYETKVSIRWNDFPCSEKFSSFRLIVARRGENFFGNEIKTEINFIFYRAGLEGRAIQKFDAQCSAARFNRSWCLWDIIVEIPLTDQHIASHEPRWRKIITENKRNIKSETSGEMLKGKFDNTKTNLNQNLHL